MKTERFEKMMEGIKWGGDYLKGKAEPSRRHEVSVKVPDVKGIRGKLKVSQGEFASMLGISVRTIQNWEQKRRVPEGPARVLLEVAASYPAIIRSLSEAGQTKSRSKPLRPKKVGNVPKTPNRQPRRHSSPLQRNS